MKKILITDLLILITIASFFSIAYATNSSFLDAAQDAIDAYKPDQEAENDTISDYINQLENEMIYTNALLNATQNAAKEWEEAQKKEQETLNKYMASVEAEILVSDLEEKLDVYKTSVQIDNKLYLKYSNTEKNNIYKLMTSNAQKTFEKNANYFKKSGANYYDTGRLRTLPIINYTDTLYSFLEVTSATENSATFDVILKNIVTGDIDETYKDGLKIVKKDGVWLIDSLKFKSKIEEWDTYPEYPVIEEEKTENKQENNKTEENKKEENKVVENNVTEETNKIDNTNIQNNNVENVNTGNNTFDTSNEITDVTTIGSLNNYKTILKYILYVTIGLLTVGLIYFVYKIVKHSKKDNSNNL